MRQLSSLGLLIAITLFVPSSSQIVNGTQVFVVRRDENNNFQLVPQANSTRSSPVVARSASEQRESIAVSTRTRDNLIRQESMEFLQSMILGGKPGRDFPNYSRPPRTKFSCRQMNYDGGMFADTDTGCQVYHVCHSSRKDTFMCPTGTLFNQAIMACDFWYNVNCESSASFYKMNEQLYHPYQTRRVSFDTPVIRRSDRPISSVPPPPPPPVPSNSIPRPTFQVPVKPRQSPPSLIPSSTTTTSTAATTSTTSTSTTTVRPIIPVTSESTRTRKPTTPRIRFITSTRPRTTEEPEDRDWVFAWLKQENGTRADKQILPSHVNSGRGDRTLVKKMGLESLPLASLTSQVTSPRVNGGDLSTSRTRISLVGVRRNRVSETTTQSAAAAAAATTTATATTKARETREPSTTASAAGGDADGEREGASTTHDRRAASTTPYSMTSSPLQQQVTSSTLLPSTSTSRKEHVTDAPSFTAGREQGSNLPLSQGESRSTTNHTSTGKPVNSTTGIISGESNTPKVQSKQQKANSWLFPLEFMGI